MQSKKLAGAKPSAQTKQYIDIAEIKEDVVVLKDGTFRAVLLCSSINFALKGDEEQEAIIQAYMQFLNALEYPLQIVIQSRRLNIDPYLEKLKEIERKQNNDLLRAQIVEYRSFVSELVTLGNIMQKKFYVIVPLDPLSNKRKGFFSRLQESLTPALTVKIADKRFRDRKDALMQRVELIQSLLSSMSIQAVPLDTQSLIELYYTVYNPDIFDIQKMQPVGELRVEG